MFSIPVVAYILTVVLVNVGFSYVPMIETPVGLLSPMAVVVGAVFVIRDYAQRRAGHGVLLAMGVATLLSYALADPYVATASAIAFASAEIADYLVYTLTKRSFRERVLISSLISAPIDTAVFLFGINGFTIGTFVLMVLSKLVAAAVIWVMYRARPMEEPVVTADGIAYPTFNRPI
jgi:uncharacterized PurR-regulated membrane protein YhhQ (DUF165 family)